MFVESIMPSNHFILCHSLFFLPSIFWSIRVLSNESALCIRWPKYWSFSFSISSSNEYLGLISFKIDWAWPACSPGDTQESFPAPQFETISSSELSLLYDPTLTSTYDCCKSHIYVLVAQSCPTLCDHMDYRPSSSFVHGIFQVRMLKWIAISFAKGSSKPEFKPESP